MIPWPHTGIGLAPKFNPFRRTFQINADLSLPPVYPGKYPLIAPVAYDSPFMVPEGVVLIYIFIGKTICN